ncbi:MAG: LON domain containing protein [Nitrosopumilus sp.]|nr:MAG: LON domain containing protein [Nitrosopumilus sp.]|tara:strand:- start:1645 stop:2373 length:729 start_codon:yes stop_codon:yes gene_type:complete
MSETKIIPIFPLDLVLFPRQELPLRIFEPRYKQLVDDCMLGDGQFGVCLIDEQNSVNGWNSPKLVGTIAKISKCEDVELDGLQLHIETMGRNSFRIKKIIPPALSQPDNYDPLSVEGHQEVSKIHEEIGTQEKMYIQAEVELIPEIDENISLVRWKALVELWKKKIIHQALTSDPSNPHAVNSHALDHVLEQYYLNSDSPTIDYIYSLAALGAKDPNELQPLLEAPTMEDLIESTKELLTVK